MIKGISFLRPAGSAAVYDRLASFFSALGFAPGKGWQEEKSRGASFLAPLGNLEFFDGEFPSTADVLVEVTALDAVYQAAENWLRAQGEPAEQAAEKLGVSGEDEGEGPSVAKAGIDSFGFMRGFKPPPPSDVSFPAACVSRLSPITETHWKSRIFSVEPEPGFPFTFWAWTDPLRGKPTAIEGDLSAAGMKFAIVVARWNAVVTERLLDAALDALLRSGAHRTEIEVVRVPGAWEIPAAARTVANLGHVDAIITLGCLLRGETAHYEAIYNEVARGIGESQQQTGIPHSFGVLTCETLEQALNRAGIKAGNKGFEAATAAIEMVSLSRKLKESRGSHGQVSVRGVIEGGPA